MEQIALRADDADFAIRDFDTLSQRAEMIAAIPAAVDPDPLPRGPGELPDHGRCDGLLA
ncbi:MAG TPA: hypothetical protein VKT70_15590 [Stellaceae bacterium]|nr:hypothetical protein [Stellaceae bacterium]